jgi:2',3'-cyclic-nucleotide 2'-phosphodiesterase (5'-nucleotidase family)
MGIPSVALPGRSQHPIRWLWLGLLLALCACAEQHENPVLKGQDIRLAFLHTSDIHGRLLPYRMQVTLTDEDFGLDQANEPFGGVARMGHVINRERARGERVVYLDSGDVFQGAPIFNAFMGDAELEAMGYLNPDAMVLGNHEFDTGLDNLVAKLKDRLSFPLLAANYYYYSDNDLGWLSQPYVILNKGGVRIGVLGIGDFSSLSSLTDIGNSLKMMPLDMAETVQYYVGMLRPQVDIMVVLSHAGLSHDQELIAETEGVDIVFGGHLHIVLNPPAVLKNRKGEDVLLVHSGAFAKYVGRLDVILRHDADGRMRVASHDYTLFPIDSTLPEDPKLAQLMEDYRLGLNQKIDLTSTFGYSARLLTKYGYEGGDSALGNLVSEAVRRYARVDIGFTNTLGIRTNMYPGPITLDDMYNIFPFDNTITLMYMSGTDLRNLFDYVAQRSSGRGCVSQLQVAGVQFVMNCNPEPPPFYYECHDCKHLDEDGQEVWTHWDGCLADCMAACAGAAACQRDCVLGKFANCILSRTDKIEDALCLESCLPMYLSEGQGAMLKCFDECFPRSEDLALTQCPDPMLVTDPDKCKTIPIIQGEVYEVATNDYIAQGGSGFTILKSNNTQQDTGLPLREAVLEMIMSGGACLDQCVEEGGLATCPVYNDCLGQVSNFLDSFCEGVDATGGLDWTASPEGCALDYGACAKDQDCYPVEDYCLDEGCTPCASTGACMVLDPESFCVNGWCQKKTWSCAEGRCHRACEADADCPGGEVPGQSSCVGGLCFPRQGLPCLDQAECADPWRACFGGGQACLKDDECGAGQGCRGRLCVPEFQACQTNQDCPDAGPCFRGWCGAPTDECDAPADCPDGACLEGRCAFACGPCEGPQHCPTGQVCAQGLCLQPLQECLDNRCRALCTGDAGCAPGDRCADGLCLPKPCTGELTGEQLCRTNNQHRAQQRCLRIPCVDSNVDGRIGRILPENLEDLEFTFVPNDPEDIDDE